MRPAHAGTYKSHATRKQAVDRRAARLGRGGMHGRTVRCPAEWKYRLAKSKFSGKQSRRNELWLNHGAIVDGCYCLWKAHSATSWIALIVAALVMVLLGLRTLNMHNLHSILMEGS